MRRYVLIFFSVIFLLSGCTDGVQENTETGEQEILSETGAYPESNSETVPKTYQVGAEAAPHAVYEWAAWIDEDKALHFPEDFEEHYAGYDSMDEWYACYYIPKEALEIATTISLLDVATDCPFYSPWMYNFPSEYIECSSQLFNAADELWNREEIAEEILELYEQEKFMENCSYDQGNERDAYMERAIHIQGRIMTEEVLLATDKAFSEMTEEMRIRTLAAVEEKMEQRRSGDFVTNQGTSAFYFYISELHETTGSEWYDYIETLDQYQYLLEELDTLHRW